MMSNFASVLLPICLSGNAWASVIAGRRDQRWHFLRYYSMLRHEVAIGVKKIKCGKRDNEVANISLVYRVEIIILSKCHPTESPNWLTMSMGIADVRILKSLIQVSASLNATFRCRYDAAKSKTSMYRKIIMLNTVISAGIKYNNKLMIFVI